MELTRRQQLDFFEELIKEDSKVTTFDEIIKKEDNFKLRLLEKKYDKHLTSIIHQVKKNNKKEYLFDM